MNFSYSAKVLLIYCIILTFYLYFFDTKANWQKQRQKIGLAQVDDYSPPHLLLRCPFNKKLYAWSCIQLFLSNVLISAIIFGIFYMQNPNIEFLSELDYIKTFFSLFIMYALVIGIPVTSGESVSSEQSEHSKNILKIVWHFKGKCIESLVYKEDKYLKSEIKLTIRQWYENRHKDCSTELGCLIARIGNDFLNKKVRVDNDGMPIEVLQDASLHLVKLYNEDSPVLLDYIEHFFQQTVKDFNITLVDVIEFFKNVSLFAEGMTKDSIKKQIDDLLFKNGYGNIKRESLSNLRKIILNINEHIETEKSDLEPEEQKTGIRITQHDN